MPLRIAAGSRLSAAAKLSTPALVLRCPRQSRSCVRPAYPPMSGCQQTLNNLLAQSPKVERGTANSAQAPAKRSNPPSSKVRTTASSAANPSSLAKPGVNERMWFAYAAQQLVHSHPVCSTEGPTDADGLLAEIKPLPVRKDHISWDIITPQAVAKAACEKWKQTCLAREEGSACVHLDLALGCYFWIGMSVFRQTAHGERWRCPPTSWPTMPMMRGLPARLVTARARSRGKGGVPAGCSVIHTIGTCWRAAVDGSGWRGR